MLRRSCSAEQHAGFCADLWRGRLPGPLRINLGKGCGMHGTKRNGSENDPVDLFGDDQLFVVFVVANGGADLEHFEVHSYEEARSIILQVLTSF